MTSNSGNESDADRSEEIGLQRISRKIRRWEERKQACLALLPENYPELAGEKEWFAYKDLRKWWSRPMVNEFVNIYGTDDMWLPGSLGKKGRPPEKVFMGYLETLQRGQNARKLPEEERNALLTGLPTQLFRRPKGRDRSDEALEAYRDRMDGIKRQVEDFLVQTAIELWDTPESESYKIMEMSKTLAVSHLPRFLSKLRIKAGLPGNSWMQAPLGVAPSKSKEGNSKVDLGKESLSPYTIKKWLKRADIISPFIPKNATTGGG